MGTLKGYRLYQFLIQRLNRPYPKQCMTWLYTHGPGGYGRVIVPGQHVLQLVHRVAYEYVHGPIPLELEIDHLCRVRDCYNPDHLEAVSHKENVRRGVSARKANHTVRKAHDN